MIFKNEGTWFYFNDNAEDGGVCLKILTPGDVRKIEKATVTKKAEIVKGDQTTKPIRIEWIEVNEELRQEMQWDALISDWKKVDPDGTGEIECTYENKLRMMNDYIEFAQFIVKSIGILTQTEPTEKEKEKN